MTVDGTVTNEFGSDAQHRHPSHHDGPDGDCGLPRPRRQDRADRDQRHDYGVRPAQPNPGRRAPSTSWRVRTETCGSRRSTATRWHDHHRRGDHRIHRRDHPSMITAGPDGAVWSNPTPSRPATPTRSGGSAPTPATPSPNSRRPRTTASHRGSRPGRTGALVHRGHRQQRRDGSPPTAISANSPYRRRIRSVQHRDRFGRKPWFANSTATRSASSWPRSRPYVTPLRQRRRQHLQGTAGADLIYGYNRTGPKAASSIVGPEWRPASPSRCSYGAARRCESPVHRRRAGSSRFRSRDRPVRRRPSSMCPARSSRTRTGLLGLAFDPTTPATVFYVDLTTSGVTEIRRYHAGPNANVADAASAAPVLSIDLTPATRPGGSASTRGDLYIATGDGGTTPDSAQDLDSCAARFCASTCTVTTSRYRAQLCDPRRQSLRRDWARRGDLCPWTAQPVAAELRPRARRLLHRRCRPGPLGRNRPRTKRRQLRLAPIRRAGGSLSRPADRRIGRPAHVSYDHSLGQSITGGYVYRGTAMPSLVGTYIYGDYITGRVFTLRLDGGSWVATERTSQIMTTAGAINNPSSFGEDARGNLMSSTSTATSSSSRRPGLRRSGRYSQRTRRQRYAVWRVG